MARNPIKNADTAFAALDDLITACQDGTFYEDVDRSMELIADAQKAVEYLRMPGHLPLR
jgi:hypothetical protein